MVKADLEDPAAPVPVHDPVLGQVLDGRFEILERLGAGGMGAVYKARQLPLDRLVAVKVLSTGGVLSKDPSFQKRFFLEASLTSKLRHPNTIQVFDYGRAASGLFFIAMEYLEGITLAELLAREGALAWPRAMGIAQQICRSLREAHRAGILHRDLKPANVMLLKEDVEYDVVKVLDFGLVKSMQTDEGNKDAELTRAGMFLGSPLYASPEQVRNKSDARSDIYSLGVLMFQMLTGRTPFQGAPSVELLVHHVHTPPPALRHVRPDLDIPIEVEALVLKCLHKRPEDRYQSMDELLEATRSLFSQLGNVLVLPASAPSLSSSAPPALRPPSQPTLGLPVALSEDESHTEKRPVAGKVAGALGIAALALLLGFAVTAFIGKQRMAQRQAEASASSRVGPASSGSTLPTSIEPTDAPVTTHEPEDAPGGKDAPATVAAGAEALPSTTAAVKPAHAPVRFRIESQPSGAHVLVGGKELGITPFLFERPAREDGLAEARITLELDGYQRASVTAKGSGPEVRLRERLRKSPHSRSGSNKDADPTRLDPYKDDPYQ